MIGIESFKDQSFSQFSNILISDVSLQPENYFKFKYDRHKAGYQRHSKKIDRLQNIEERLDKENINMKELIGDQKYLQEIPQWNSNKNIKFEEKSE